MECQKNSQSSAGYGGSHTTDQIDSMELPDPSCFIGETPKETPHKIAGFMANLPMSET